MSSSNVKDGLGTRAFDPPRQALIVKQQGCRYAFGDYAGALRAAQDKKGLPHSKLFQVGRSDLGDPGVVVGSEAGFLLEREDQALDFGELLVGKLGDELVGGGGGGGVAVAAIDVNLIELSGRSAGAVLRADSADRHFPIGQLVDDDGVVSGGAVNGQHMRTADRCRVEESADFELFEFCPRVSDCRLLPCALEGRPSAGAW